MADADRQEATIPRFRWLTYANVVSTLCLFVVLGGAAYAIGVAKHSVGTKQLKRNAVVSKKVANGSLRAVDFGSDQLPRGPQGEQGPQGLQGPTGPAGPTAGAAGGNAGDPPAGGVLRTTTGSAQFTSDSPGRVMVLGHFDSANWQCLNLAGACVLNVGLYVDGKPVAGTLASASLAAGSAVTPFARYDRYGLSTTVSPGAHTVAIQARETAGISAAGLESVQNVSVGAILIGG